ncbi:hypothetical protein ACL0VS_15540 [Chryseobacterium sp. PMSZPI]|uniref:hypothetical protein n=1 Tax=Chryseobacterium sp. PMSZPI TaxID=1033900 RepID=UPI0039A36B6B
MEIDFLAYKVRSNDTLQSIASRVGMTGEELKLFHNSRCKKTDTIWFENLNEVKNIFVPTHFKTEKQKEQEQKNILPPALLSDSFFAKTYTVSETFESPFENPLHIDYIIDLDIHKDKDQNVYILSYYQKNFKSDGSTSDDKMSNLSLACMESIMPISFMINADGKITGLADHKSIIENFASQRKELEDFFIGEVSQKYFDTFQNNLENEKLLLQQFSTTLLFQTLFPKMDWFHKKTSWTESFHLVQNSFPVQCHMDIEYENEEEDFVVTVLKGNITEACSSQEIVRGIKQETLSQDRASGDIILKYTTHKKHKTLFQTQADISVRHKGEIIHQHNLTITQG